MSKKRYTYAVGACGPTIMYKTIYAENAEDTARMRYEDEFDTFSEEQKRNAISYFEEEDRQRDIIPKEKQEELLQYQIITEEDIPEIEETEFTEETLDAVGNNLKQGDIVAIVYHPEAYKFFTRVAIVSGKNGQYITTILLGTGEEAKFKVGKDGVSFAKTVKISREFPKTSENEKLDSVGHAIHVGDTVAVRKPVELGNTQKGFEIGGIVTRMTDKMVFFKDTEGNEKRKGYTSIVVY